MSRSKLFVVARSFQGGKTFETFDKEKFNRGLVIPLKKLFTTAPEQLVGVSVITCVEPGSKYSEEVRHDRNDVTRPYDNDSDNQTPTKYYLCKEFPDEVASGRLIPVLCNDWGLNIGSATAINAGINVARQYDADKVMIWSPEIDLSGHMIAEMLNHMDIHALKLVGYMRNRWYQRLQWAFAQNTCNIWDMSLLDEVSGMNPQCNGDGVTCVSTLEYGDVPLAGMEDIEAYFRASVAAGEFIRWGAVGMRHPVTWNLALKEPGTDEYENNLKKIARQALVMDEYAARIFPHLKPIEVYDKMMEVASFS